MEISLLLPLKILLKHMYCALYSPIKLFFLYIHLLLYIGNTSLPFPLFLLLNSLMVHILHLLVFALLDMSFVDMAWVRTFSFYLVFYYIYLVFALLYTNLLYSLCIHFFLV